MSELVIERESEFGNRLMLILAMGVLFLGLFLVFFPLDALDAYGVHLHDNFHEFRHSIGIACH